MVQGLQSIHEVNDFLMVNVHILETDLGDTNVWMLNGGPTAWSEAELPLNKKSWRFVN